jgi:rhodanese-related sulfurtransferase
MIKHIVMLILLSVTLSAQNSDAFEEYLQDLTGEFEIEQIQADSAILSKAIVLDTREKEEYEVSRLKNAIWIGYDDFDMTAVDSLDRDKELIVYCSVGYRSSKIGIELKEAGYQDVKNLYGGIFKWANEGRPLYSDSTQTVRIHGYNRKWGRFITNPELIKVF